MEERRLEHAEIEQLRASLPPCDGTVPKYEVWAPPAAHLGTKLPPDPERHICTFTAEQNGVGGWTWVCEPA
jgi:hypothetical protein